MKTPKTTHVVYHVASTMLRGEYLRKFDADRLATKLNAHQAKMDLTETSAAFAVADRETYETKIVHMVTRKNLQSGLEYQEPSNTPSYMSPASEAYWSM